jgi:hypothetical protein
MELDVEKPVEESKPETVTISKAEYERMARERDEAKNSERFWAEKARGSRKEPEAESAEEPVEIDTSDLIPEVTGVEGVDESIFNDPDKWVEAVGKGPKAIQALIRKEGYVNAEQVAEIAAKVARRTVAVERTKISTDHKLMTQFPELADSKSEFFKTTAEEFNALIEDDPSAKNNPATLFAAARIAKAKLGKARRAAGDEDDDEDIYERPDPEEERRTRVRAQDGSRGGRPSRKAEADDVISPQAKSVLEEMGVKEDDFRAKAKSLGVSRRSR